MNEREKAREIIKGHAENRVTGKRGEEENGNKRGERDKRKEEREAGKEMKE